MVAGDIFPKLMGKYARDLAVPLTKIFHTITSTSVWPIAWKRERVSVIPKKNLQEEYGDLRNISCTQLFLKICESFVLLWAMEEISVKPNQFRGMKGKSSSHMLISIWNKICENSEDYRSGTVIDYTKAFNRVSYQRCLKA